MTMPAIYVQRFSRNPAQFDVTEQSKELDSVEWSCTNTLINGVNSTAMQSSFATLNKVDTEMCEQVFSWLSRYAPITQKMNQHFFVPLVRYAK